MRYAVFEGRRLAAVVARMTAAILTVVGLAVLGMTVITLPGSWVARSAAGEAKGAGKMEFSHIGIVTNDKKPDERFVEATRVWVTDFRVHPFHVEWLRFEPDTPVTGPLRERPHVAYYVDHIERAADGLKVLAEPFDPGVFGVARVGFYQTADGAVVEFMEKRKEQ